jgi:anti-sigma-K factor RskA
LNIEAYIASGILEAYALGELNAAERAAVEQALAQYSALRDELARIELTQEELLLALAIAPKSSMQQQVMDKIPQAKEIAMPRVTLWRNAMAASVVFGLLAAGMALYYRSQWQTAEQNLNDLVAQNQRMATEYNVVNQRLDQLETDVRIINNPGFKRTVLKGTDQAPQALASVYWNETTREVYLSIQNLQALAEEEQYQLWAIIDGKPVDAGVFDGDRTSLLKMNAIQGAVAFAVTIEPRGGKPSPTLETMQVMGKVG